jgi:hypothetical protein
MDKNIDIESNLQIDSCLWNLYVRYCGFPKLYLPLPHFFAKESVMGN